MFARGLGFL